MKPLAQPGSAAQSQEQNPPLHVDLPPQRSQLLPQQALVSCSQLLVALLR